MPGGVVMVAAYQVNAFADAGYGAQDIFRTA